MFETNQQQDTSINASDTPPGIPYIFYYLKLQIRPDTIRSKDTSRTNPDTPIHVWTRLKIRVKILDTTSQYDKKPADLDWRYKQFRA